VVEEGWGEVEGGEGEGVIICLMEGGRVCIMGEGEEGGEEEGRG